MLASVRFQSIWDHYTHLKGSPGLGDWITNFCAINLANALIQAGFPGMRKMGRETTPFGGNSLLFRVKDLNDYLTENNVGLKSQIARIEEIGGKQGIICFKITFSNATGHISLWDGSTPHPKDSYLADHLAECFERAEKIDFFQFA